jgi:hypothetical protein
MKNADDTTISESVADDKRAARASWVLAAGQSSTRNLASGCVHLESSQCARGKESMMFNPLSVDVAEINRRERLEQAESHRMFQRSSASHPIERDKHIKAFHRQLLEQLPKAEHRARRREATADRGLP